LAKSKEYELAIKIAGEIEKSFYSSTKLTKKELDSIAKTAATASNGVGSSFTTGFDKASGGLGALSKAASKAFDVVKSAAVVAATAVAAIAAASLTSGIEFESAFAGVKKTTNATKAEYDELREGIIAMTDVIPATASEIAEVAESAGQLGIAKENLLEFSRVMIDLGESTNLTATDAASAIAKFANITGMGTDEYDNLGSTIVALGNNFATTEADIVNMATKLAASGELAGLSESQIMALSTSMSSVGIEAEAGGSAMSKLLKNMQVSVETGGGLLKDFASVANMSAKEFQTKFGEDAVGALSSFIDGLDDVKRNGKSATVILDDMGLTEVRLSNMILSLANADGLMTDALTLSNEAWEENTALTNEAAQRYATTESKISIFKNGLKGLGIRIFDEISKPLQEGISTATNFVGDLTDNVLPTMVSAFSKNLPTVIRNVKKFTGAFLEFAEPVLSLGKWLIKNPNVIVSTLVGIGATIASYKLATTIMSVASAISALTPAGATILGISAAIAAVAGITSYFSMIETNMAKQNLAEHFGDITLSMGELEDAAKHIIGSNYFGQIDDLMAAVSLSDGFLSGMKEAQDEINKMHWKFSVVLNISEEDLANYAESAGQYVKNAQDYITNQGYTVSIATTLLLGNSEGTNVMNAENNAFYASLSSSADALGKELNTILQESLDSGLTIDTEKKVTEILSQIDEITNLVAQADSDAAFQMIEIQFSGKDLDADTYQNLQTSISEYTDQTIAGANTALQESLKSINAQLQFGSITQGEYDTKKQEYVSGYYELQANAILKGYNFMKNTITDTYGTEIEPAMDAVNKAMENKISEVMTNKDWWNTYSAPEDWTNALNIVAMEALGASNLSKEAENAVKMLLDGMKPTAEQLATLSTQIQEAGGTVPDGIAKAMTDTKALSVLTGSESAMWKLIGSSLGNSEEYAVVIEAAKQNGGNIAQEVIDSMREKQPMAEQTAEDLLMAVKKSMGEGFDVTIPIGITYKTVSDYTKSNSLDGHADGGIFDKPHVAWFAEAGPEAAIPLDGSQNAIGLWQKVGKLLGVYSNAESSGSGKDSFTSFDSNTGSIPSNEDNSFSSLLNKLQIGNKSESKSKASSGNITYSPILNFYGGTPTKEDIVEASRTSQDEFDEKMEYWMSQKDRLGFA